MIIAMVFLLFCGEPKIDFNDSVPSKNYKVEKWEVTAWVASVTLDTASTYKAFREYNAKEVSPLYSFDSNTKFVDMWAQIAITDVAVQYLFWKTMKRKTIRIFITSHGVAATWNIYQMIKR